ncbi:hypothetical protein HKX48_001978, partial [Thoreauomyces humboldtii]
MLQQQQRPVYAFPHSGQPTRQPPIANRQQQQQQSDPLTTPRRARSTDTTTDTAKRDLAAFVAGFFPASKIRSAASAPAPAPAPAPLPSRRQQRTLQRGARSPSPPPRWDVPFSNGSSNAASSDPTESDSSHSISNSWRTADQGPDSSLPSPLLQNSHPPERHDYVEDLPNLALSDSDESDMLMADGYLTDLHDVVDDDEKQEKAVPRFDTEPLHVDALHDSGKDDLEMSPVLLAQQDCSLSVPSTDDGGPGGDITQPKVQARLTEGNSSKCFDMDPFQALEDELEDSRGIEKSLNLHVEIEVEASDGEDAEHDDDRSSTPEAETDRDDSGYQEDIKFEFTSQPVPSRLADIGTSQARKSPRPPPCTKPLSRHHQYPFDVLVDKITLRVHCNNQWKVIKDVSLLHFLGNGHLVQACSAGTVIDYSLRQPMKMFLQHDGWAELEALARCFGRGGRRCMCECPLGDRLCHVGHGHGVAAALVVPSTPTDSAALATYAETADLLAAGSKRASYGHCSLDGSNDNDNDNDNDNGNGNGNDSDDDDDNAAVECWILPTVDVSATRALLERVIERERRHLHTQVEDCPPWAEM